MASIFTSREMTYFSSGDNAGLMGILDDALRKMKVVAERGYGSLSAFAREAGYEMRCPGAEIEGKS